MQVLTELMLPAGTGLIWKSVKLSSHQPVQEDVDPQFSLGGNTDISLPHEKEKLDKDI